jgi:hypothetical protein
MQPESVAPTDRKALRSVSNELASSARVFQSSWPKRQLIAGLKLQLYRPDLSDAWLSASNAANALLTASNEEYENFVNDPSGAGDADVSTEQKAFELSLERFSKALSKGDRGDRQPTHKIFPIW